jgi:phosphoenolpyruvate carboxykinase (ATP)
VPDEILEPASSWSDKEEYDKKYKQLAQRFVENFKRFEAQASPDVIGAGPKL